ncbi:MAG TPA: efflux RND transporter periplasmic adaptor subunit [Croceibacterium sp.]|nr:efflux RND transporter periplasmic adaptor subunit [Croceibacterium sp.]
MNYETTMADLGGAPNPLVDEIEIDGSRARRRRVIMGAIAAVVLLALAAWMMSRGASDSNALKSSNTSATPTVSVVEPGQTTITGLINATGSLAATHEVAVGVVGEGGRVIAVPVQIGDWVRRGQVLAVIDRSVQNEQAAGSAAQIQVAQANAQLAQSNLDRALKLVDRGFISKADVDRLTSTRDAAIAQVKVAQASYRELLARNARLNIVAPVSGLILDRKVEVGQVLAAGSNAPFTIAQDGQMELLAKVGEDDLGTIAVGATAQVTPVGTDKAFTGQIWKKEPTIDQTDRQGIVRIALPYDPAIHPGGFASAVVQGGTVVAPRLPESAIMSDEKGNYVYVVGRGNKIERRAVKTGTVTDQGTAIVSGLSGTERVVLRAGGFLNPGDTIRPVLSNKR